MESLSVVLLAYNEEENLKIFIPRVIKSVDSLNIEYEILVVDSAKPTDHTAVVCKEYKAKYIPQEQPGYGGAFRTGIKYASKDRMLVLDVDGSHQPETIPAVYKKAVKDYDLVIGSRYVKGGQTSDKVSSKIMSRLLNNAFRIALGIRAKDISTSFRIYKTRQLKKTKLKCINFDVLEEVVFILKMNNKNFKIGEVPIVFEKRILGESKRRLIPFIMTYLTTLIKLFGMRIKHVFVKETVEEPSI